MTDLFHDNARELADEQGRCRALMTQRQANAPLKPKVAQEACDHGLFSDQGGPTRPGRHGTERKTLMITDTERNIDAALSALMKACGFSSESDTERLFLVLHEAVQVVANNWHVVEESHEDGLCYNVNALLSEAIVKALDRHYPHAANENVKEH